MPPWFYSGHPPNLAPFLLGWNLQQFRFWETKAEILAPMWPVRVAVKTWEVADIAPPVEADNIAPILAMFHVGTFLQVAWVFMVPKDTILVLVLMTIAVAVFALLDVLMLRTVVYKHLERFDQGMRSIQLPNHALFRNW